MINIDYIMELIHWDKSEEEQKKGRELAKKVKILYVFIQPGGNNTDKPVWDNCALILAEHSDNELNDYLYDLIEWLQDMNWPGAFCIFNRLKKYKNKENLISACEFCKKQAKKLEDEVWESNINDLYVPKFYGFNIN